MSKNTIYLEGESLKGLLACWTFTILDITHNTIMLLIKLFRIGPVSGPRLAVLDRGRRPRSNAADRGPVTGPIRNNLINKIFIN